MSFSKSDRESAVRQIIEAVATVGFLIWKEQHREDFVSDLASSTPEQIRDEYFQVFEQVAGAEIREMAKDATDERLLDTLEEWIERAECMSLLDYRKERELQTKQPAKDRDWDMEH